MGKKDTTTKLLTKDNDVFAEIFNTFLFKKKVVDPAKLKEKDTTELVAIAEKVIAEQKYRDVLKTAEVKTDDKFAYLLLGVENQTDVHYAMVIRSMLYDALNYSAQMMEVGKEVRKDKETEYSRAEWLSGFPKNKKITPVITLVLCWNPDKWDAPKSLYEMMDPAVVKEYGKWINDYTINLVSVHDLPDKQLTKTKTEIGLALEFSKYSKDKKKIMAYQNDKRFKNLSNECVATINEMADTTFKLNRKGGNVNMCEGIRLMQEEAAEAAAEKAKKSTQDESIVLVYKQLKVAHPEDSDAKIIKFLADTFGRSQKAIRSLVL